MLQTIKKKIEEIAFERCGKCPAYYQTVDFWEEADEGCCIHKDINEFCMISLLPNILSKIYINFKLKQEEKVFLKLCKKDYIDEE